MKKIEITTAEINELTFDKILTQNGKMRKTSKENKIRLYNFGITAYKSHSTGRITCPFAAKCVAFCYASKGSYIWNNTKKAYERRYLLTQNTELFKSKLIESIKRRKATHIRIHDSGDFYNHTYIRDWFEIINEFPNVVFYAYTKSKKLFDPIKGLIPKNLILIYSLGSKNDNLIDMSFERHAKIFQSEEQLIKEGYINASKNDLFAIGENPKIGLLIH